MNANPSDRAGVQLLAPLIEGGNYFIPPLSNDLQPVMAV